MRDAWEYCNLCTQWDGGLGDKKFDVLVIFFSLRDGKVKEERRTYKTPYSVKPENTPEALSTVFAILGAEGWELISVTRHSRGSGTGFTIFAEAILKRRIEAR